MAGCPSGQWEGTVNPPALPSKVQILHPPLVVSLSFTKKILNDKLKIVKRALFKGWKDSPTLLMVLAGLFYSSWPLGYWLNPEANQGLASDLEASHQPYSWVFISMDVACGILVGMVSWKLLTIVRSSPNRKNQLGLWIAVLGTGVFGLFTAVDAVLPLNCIQGSPQCVMTLNNSYFVIHGIFSIGSITGLTISIVAIWLLLLLREDAVMSLAHLTPAMFLVVWLGFGALTLYLILHNRSSALSQHFFIGFCCLWLIALPYFVRLVIRLQIPSTNIKAKMH